MGFVDGAKEWLFRVAIQKVGKRAIQLTAAWVAGLQLKKYGVEVDPQALTVAIYSGIELARNWAKTKYGWSWL